MGYTIGLVSVSFRKKSPEEILCAMQNAGLSHIEWGSDLHAPCDDMETLGKIAKLQEQYGIRCCSYGTYFRLGITPLDTLKDYISAARVLGTRVLRLWCGNKNSENYTQDEKARLFQDCKAAAKLAEKNSVILCMECHNDTYTNRKEGALELMETINSDCFRMYWQPNQFQTEAENMAYAKLISPYVVNIHVFNWKGTEKYPLLDALSTWRNYLACFDGGQALLLEFMPDGKLESLETEASALKEIVK